MTYPNPEQQQVLRRLNGTLLVLAPAGTGKTRLMADRLAADDASIPILIVHPSKGFEFVTVIITRRFASPSAPSANPRFASSNPQTPIVPAPHPFATFEPLRFKSSPLNRHPSLATHLIPLIFHS